MNSEIFILYEHVKRHVLTYTCNIVFMTVLNSRKRFAPAIRQDELFEYNDTENADIEWPNFIS